MQGKTLLRDKKVLLNAFCLEFSSPRCNFLDWLLIQNIIGILISGSVQSILETKSILVRQFLKDPLHDDK